VYAATEEEEEEASEAVAAAIAVAAFHCLYLLLCRSHALRSCGAHRIGHGLSMRSNPDLVRYVANHGIAIECCPTSNVHTSGIRRLEDHPLREYFDAGVRTVICTGNWFSFSTSMNSL
jgi:adenosine deaminase